jgi:hypothetical protein
MIDRFDNLLRQLFLDQIGELTDEAQVRLPVTRCRLAYLCS